MWLELMVRQRGKSYYIEAFNKIKTKHPDWKLEFWGDIDYDKKYYKNVRI